MVHHFLVEGVRGVVIEWSIFNGEIGVKLESASSHPENRKSYGLPSLIIFSYSPFTTLFAPLPSPWKVIGGLNFIEEFFNLKPGYDYYDMHNFQKIANPEASRSRIKGGKG